jgi:DNA-directed RNA polymerase subunit M/transcription elongation factor TFIIS
MPAVPRAKILSQTSGTATSAQPRNRRRSRAAGPSIPLGSLTQRENRASIQCQACGSTRITRLTMNLTDGTPVEFTSCHRCEHRTWEHGGDALSVDSVLDRARRD